MTADMASRFRDGGPCPTCGEPTEHFRNVGSNRWMVVKHMAPLAPGRKRRSECVTSYQLARDSAVAR